MAMRSRLYGRLLRSSEQLQRHFDRLGGSGDMTEFDKLLLRVALRPSDAANGSVRRIGASRYVIDAVQGGLKRPGGLPGVVKEAFRAPGAPDSPTPDLSRAFEYLKFANELGEVFEKVYLPQERHVDQAFNLGHIVFHHQLNMKCVIYGYDARADEGLFAQTKTTHLDETEPYFHVISEDGRFRYVGQSDVELCRGEAVQFLDSLREQHAESEGFRFAEGVLFTAVSTDRLIPNPDLWRRFPDIDGRHTASGLASVPLTRQYDALPIPQQRSVDGEARPSLFSFFASLFSSAPAENKKKVK